MICAILARQRHESLFQEMAAATARGAKLLELRLDYLQNEPRLKEILSHRTCPVIATLRRQSDGGRWVGPEERRLQLLRASVLEGFDFVDLEDDVAHHVPRHGRTKRIVSHHDMNKMPEDLKVLWERMLQLDPDVIKIAARASKITDSFRMLKLVDRAGIPTIGICMGEEGQPTRILAGKVGSPFTYAAFNPERVVAPGLLSFDEMVGLYDAESINRETEILGVIGDPIAHSLSPLVHNACLQEMGMNRVYLPFRVPAAHLNKFLDRITSIGVRGLSVTIPHKEEILTRGEAFDELVLETDSANTLVIDAQGVWRMYNTDGPAAVAALEKSLPPAEGNKSALAGKSILLLGAGGVARTLAYSFSDVGALVTISSRTAGRAHALAEAVGCRYVDWAQRSTVVADIVVNGTPVGMHPDVQQTPYHPGDMKEGMTFFDTVYNPMMTRMLTEAHERRCHIVTGVDMFVAQAEAQFRLFTGSPPPAGLMNELVMEEFSPAKKMLRDARLARRRPRNAPRTAP